ncbi:hypothetical protein DOM21_14465 [Bacteriovorax stolpii]|uniref:Uncharacterized protein n=1 Tax=Bacteriovorax stolpii TaxID=960 RepID=A0A2K9NPG1_BACTC|nr:hypothetical protein [Bacteriovorax stolpii]AUN97399.1 hypothetical protein C0V70_04590 [Bacteriovorax stolpii]QDK42631.1 hypothetical protein DOM21_14465 [Bacteriovorax stolpii]TDP52573.1 hypothetical protein C8D79_2338 [Bacteriovorax stolpii]
MKKALLLGLSLAATSIASAQEEAKKEEVKKEEVIVVASTKEPKRIYDLMYLPVQGTFFGSTGFGGKSSTTNYQYLLRDFLKVESRESTLEQSLGYSFTSTTMAGLSVAYQYDSEIKNAYGPGSTLNGTHTKSVKMKGLKDPYIFMRHRFSEAENDSGRDIDLYLSLSPKTGDSKIATTTLEGNAKRGASELNLAIDIGQKRADSAWTARFAFQGVTEATVVDAGDPADKTIAEAYGLLLGEFKYQFIFNPKFALNLGAGLGVLGERKQNNTDQEFKNVYDSTGLVTLALDLVFTPAENFSFIFAMKGMGIMEHDLKQTDLSDGSVTTLTVEQDSKGEAFLGMAYQF